MARGDRTFRIAVVAFAVGMWLPGVVVAVAGDVIASVLTYWSFLGAVGFAFGAAAVILLRRLDLDRVTFGFAAAVLPWVTLLVTVFVVALLNADEQIPRGPVADPVRTLWGSRVWDVPVVDGGPFVYSAVFTVAGVGAVSCLYAAGRVAEESNVNG